MRLTLLLLSIFTFAGCTAAAKYDIDVSCLEAQFAAKEGGANTARLVCSAGGDSFVVNCIENTVQIIDSTFYCSTHDGKSVKVKLLNIE